MDELIDILDDQGNLTGQNCLKSIAHQQGFNHATVHIWFYTFEGNVLLQQRGASRQYLIFGAWKYNLIVFEYQCSF